MLSSHICGKGEVTVKGKIKRIAAAYLAFAGIFAAGCGTGKDDGAISLVVWRAEADAGFANEVAEAFKKANPDKKYRFTFGNQGEGEVATKVLSDVENAADVFSFSSDQLNSLVNGDALARLGGDTLERLKQENAADAVDSATTDVGGEARTYAFPYTDNTFFLYYDASVFSAEDVKTLDGILAKCTSAKRFAMPLTDGWYNTSFYFGKGLGYEVTYDDALAEKKITCDFGNGTGKKVTRALQEVVVDSRVRPDADDSKIVAGFADGSVVAATSGVWNRNNIQGYLKDNFGVAKLPTYTFARGESGEEQVQLVSFAGYKLMGVSKHSKNLGEAIRFAEFYTNEENQLKRFEERGLVPTNTAAKENEKVQADACAAAITEQLGYTKTQKNVPSTLWTPMQALGNSMITAKGSFDLEKELAACVAAIEK